MVFGHVDTSNLVNKQYIVNRIKRPFLFITTSINYGIYALVDTGAAASCISHREFNKLPKSSIIGKLAAPKLKLRAAGGNELSVTGMYRISFTILGKQITHDFVIVDGLVSDAILGIDFIARHNLIVWGLGTHTKCAFPDQFHQKKINNIEKSVEFNCLDVFSKNNVTIPAKSAALISVDIRDMNQQKVKNKDVITHASNDNALEIVDACITVSDTAGILVINNNYYNYEISKWDRNATAQLTESFDIQEINSPKEPSPAATTVPNESNWPFIKDIINLQHLSTDIKSRYENLFKKYSDVFSRHKFDIGYSDAVPHTIRLKTNFPIYSPQFRVPEAHKVEILRQIDQLKKAGCLELSTSPYNSPIFLVQKKDGSSRIVLDYRKLNAQSLPDKYSIRDVKTCLDDIGKNKSSIFSCLEVTSSYHQVALDQQSRPYTSFHVPGTPKLQWTRSPMGLAGSGSTFSKLMDIVLENINNVLNYIDDILTHSKTHNEQLEGLEKVFIRLRRFGLKINPQKCLFGLSKVSYLGFEIDEHGVSPGLTKSEAIKNFPTPDTPRKIRQFLGLSNYFRSFIRHFTEISNPLIHLTCPKTNWPGGDLPPEAMAAFTKLKRELSKRPVMAFPDFNLPFTLYYDAAPGDDNNPGGLGAILTQTNTEGNLKAISYLSRTLKPHEKSASAYSLEMKSEIWAIRNFHHYLKGRSFTVVSDNQPLVTKSKSANKSINKLQQLLLEYDAKIIHMPGSKNEIADALSRNPAEQSNDLRRRRFLINVRNRCKYPRIRLSSKNRWVHRINNALPGK